MVQIEIFHETSKNGRKRIHGECFYAGVLFKFSGSTLNSEKYALKITIRVISPETGKTLQVAGKRRRAIMERLSECEKLAVEAGKQVEKLNASAEVYLKDDDLNNIEQRIETAVIRLYERHQATLEPMLKKDAEYLHMHSLYLLYQRDFFATLHIKSARSLKSKKAILEDICARLDDLALEEITVEILNKRFHIDSKKRKTLIYIAESFLNFCNRKGAFSGDNPFSLWKEDLKKHSGTVHPDSAARHAAKCRRIDFSKEKAIYEESMMNIDDSYSLIFPLAAYAHLSIDEIVAMKWPDILVEDSGDGKLLIIHNIKPECSGGVHDFSRPPLPAGKQLLLKRRELLLSKYNEAELAELYIVHLPGKPTKSISTEKASQILRSLLKKNQIHFSEAFETDKSGTIKEAYSYNGQAVIQLLHDHYVSILEEQCGVEPSSGLGHFLCGENIKDTTTSYYTSLTGEDGRFILEALLRRDRRFSPASPFEAPSKNEMEDGKIITTIPSWGRDYISAGEVEFVLHSGESLTFKARYGVCGNLMITNANDPNAVLPRIEY